MIIASHDDRKKAFRVAYDFLERHIEASGSEQEYKALAEDLVKTFADCKDNPLACRLVSGVWDFICAEIGRARNDTD